MSIRKFSELVSCIVRISTAYELSFEIESIKGGSVKTLEYYAAFFEGFLSMAIRIERNKKREIDTSGD